ncbi:MAG: phosphoribosyl-AMP cyclohydrolase [Candidatus Latescibacteria bacterium]|nr:phosphoribosyl-AMP cyclohydrolase [Candidatus Latescibacterota bacterium]
MSIADQLRFDDQGIAPVAITDHLTNRLLVLCYMNREALEKTAAEGVVYLYRRSRQQVVLKGETSGHVQRVREIRLNCEQNSLEVRVEQEVGACHAGYFSCYFRSWDGEKGQWVEHEERVFDPEAVYHKS